MSFARAAKTVKPDTTDLYNVKKFCTLTFFSLFFSLFNDLCLIMNMSKSRIFYSAMKRALTFSCLFDQVTMTQNTTDLQ